LCKEEKYYLRSIGEDSRADVADIRRDFPELSDDITFPALFDAERFFSSVLRISSRGVQLWTHYDVCELTSVNVVTSRQLFMITSFDLRPLVDNYPTQLRRGNWLLNKHLFVFLFLGNRTSYKLQQCAFGIFDNVNVTLLLYSVLSNPGFPPCPSRFPPAGCQIRSPHLKEGLPSLFLSYPPLFLPLFVLEIGPLNTAREYWRSAVDSPNGVWARAPVEDEIGAF